MYGSTFKGNLTPENLQLCLYSSILPALVGGTVGNLLFKKL
ncbi:MAG: hypothetical protein RR765_01425 [Peptostreptococcaceae bacterium]